ncbi:MAG: peptide chain release factor 2, partial [Alphaproteobacteria bacterium]
WDKSNSRLQELDEISKDLNFWDDVQNAQKLMQERQKLEYSIEGFNKLSNSLSEYVEMLELADSEEDSSLINEIEQSLISLENECSSIELESLLSGEADHNDAFLEIHSGAGGTESQDWTEMLYRMYMRWADRKGYKIKTISYSPGEEAGIKSVNIQISGINVYGWLKTESGVHRLVRISPFDSNARRHTSFASVWVYPVIDDTIVIDVAESDVRIDTYRASGSGGQHVNTTDSAVRITHIPSGIAVQCQNERSQHRNKDTAWSMLRAKLYEQEMKKREEESTEKNMQKTDIGWGHQIRSYVLHPYQLVKDLRTNVESTNPDNVLDGNIDKFIEAALANRINN